MKRALANLVNDALISITKWDSGTKLSPRFTYAISKNKKILADEVAAIEEARPKPIVEYETRKNAIRLEEAERGENGDVVWEVPNKRLKYKDVESLKSRIEELNSEFAEQITALETEITKFSEFMEEEVELNLYKIKLDDCPEFPHQDYMDIFVEADLIEE